MQPAAAPQLPRRFRSPWRPARARGRGGDADGDRRRPHLHVPDPARVSLLAAVEGDRHRGTFRYSIERALSPKLGLTRPAFNYLHDVVGAAAFHEGKAQHIAGITASGNRLRIRLVAPAGDFLTRLSLPYFAAVPLEHADRRRRRADPDPVGRPVLPPRRSRTRSRVLERNPQLPRPAAARLERIVYDLNTSSHARGSADRSGHGRLHRRRPRRLAIQARRLSRHEVRRRPGRCGTTGDALRADHRRGLRPVQHAERPAFEPSAATRRRFRARPQGSLRAARAMSRARSTFLRPSPAGAAHRWFRSSPTLPRRGSSQRGSTAP